MLPVASGKASRPFFKQSAAGILVLIGRQEQIERLLGRFLAGSQPDMVPSAIGLGLLALGQRVQNISGLMHPAALHLGLGIQKPRLPSPTARLESMLRPRVLSGLLALPVAAAKGYELLLGVFGRADHDQHTMLALL